MRKTYTLLSVILVCIGFAFNYSSVNGQQMPAFLPYTNQHIYSWDTSPFLSLQYQSPNTIPAHAAPWNSANPIPSQNLRFRLMQPPSFVQGNNNGKKFPLIIFLHGSGESAPFDPTQQDNEKQLVHGGQLHMNAVTSGKFPGFLLYPQVRKSSNGDNYWGNDWLESVRYVIDKLVADYDIDPNRIYIHGLSMGGEGTWIFIANYPEYFAAAHPMSAGGSQFYSGSNPLANYLQIPLRESQGALDTNPTPADGNSTVTNIRASGGNIEYHYYPTLGHGTWDSEYARSDFFSWFLSKKKNMIWVKNEQTSFCPGTTLSVTLGVTGNPKGTSTNETITGYEWTLNDTTSAPINTGVSPITVNSVGKYYVRFSRGTGVNQKWTYWSAPVDINLNKGPSPTPSITANGKSTTLPSLDGSPDVTLFAPANKATYNWKKDNVSSGVTTQSDIVSVAGTYTVVTQDAAETGFASNGVTPTQFRAVPQGCTSLDSNPIVVTTQDGLGSPAPPTNFFANSNTPTSIIISWDDRSNNENGFELYRTKTSGSGYTLVTIIGANNGANPLTYTDANLQANVTYYYKMRAVNNSGGSAYTPEISAKTNTDTTSPTAAVLTAGSTSRTTINLQWSGATDNVGVTQYDIYQNGTLIGSTPSTTYAATGLVAQAPYNYIVKARDAAGNTSPPSNQVNAVAANTGLFYTYYHHTGLTSTSQITGTTVIKTGVINNFLMTPRTQTDNYAFIYDGFINIPTTGSYTFYTSSDDGSQMYVNNTLVVNNDGTHGCSERASTAISLSAGSYPVKVLFFEDGGGECLTVSWKGPGIAKAAIPDNALKDTVTPPAPLTAPTNFVAANPSTYNSITLTWTDNSNNETNFEISRSATSGGTYTVIASTAANAASYINTGLSPSTTYYYKLRAINATSASVLVGPVSKATLAAPAAPVTPTGLTATPASATQINISWTTVANATGYELQKSSQSAAGFVTVYTGATNSFSDTQVNGHSTVYYKVRSLGAGGTTSAYSASVSATTPNRIPVISSIPNQGIVSGTPTAQNINITVTDADSDPLSITFSGLPATSSYQDNGYGVGVLSFTNVATGSYSITVMAGDGVSAATPVGFTLTVNGNHTPIVSSVTITSGSTVNGPNTSGTIPSITTEEGRTTTVAITVTDPDGNGELITTPLTNGLPPYALYTNPGFITAVTSGSGPTNPRILTLTIAPAIGNAGSYNIPIYFKDVNGSINTQTIALVVSPLNKSYSVSLNFSQASSNYEAVPWNNTGAPSGTDIQNLKDATGSVIRYVAFNSQFGGSPWSTSIPFTTTLPTGPGAVYTQKVRESFYRRGSNFASIAFKNLNPLLDYNVTIYGGFPEAAGVINTTRYTVTGATAQGPLDLNTANNIVNTVTLPGSIKPSSNGTLSIRIENAAGANNGNFYINALVLTALFAEPIAPIAPSNLTLTANAYNSANITWQDNSNNETGFRIWRSTTGLAGSFAVIASIAPNLITYNDNTVSGKATYYYKVSADNSYGSAETAVSIITMPDGPPVITNPGTVTVKAGLVFQQGISATDPEGDNITFTVLNLPSFASLIDNGNGTGSIRFAPQINDVGSYILTLKATDNLTVSSQLNFTLLVTDPEYDESVSLNFVATSASNAGTPWNNLIINTNSNSLKNNLGVVSPINLNVGTWSTSSDNLGMNTGSNSGIYPDNVMQSFWDITSTTGNTITMSGLDDNKRYNITLFGSRNEFWFADAIYTLTTGTINGTTSISKTLHTSKNISKVVRFSGIQSVGGTIAIKVAKPADLSAGPPVIAHRNAALNAMVIEAYTPGTIPRRATNLVAGGKSKTSIQLDWFDNSSDETGFEIYRATAPQGPFTLLTTTAPNVETYINTGLPKNTPYVYRVRAVKSGQTSVFTPDATATTFDKIILLNMNSTASAGDLQAAAPWNNTSEGDPKSGEIFSNLKDDTNAPTTTDLKIISIGSGAVLNTGYMPTPANSGVYPDAVLQNYYYFVTNNAPGHFLLSGLDKNSQYDLLFLGDEWNNLLIKYAAKLATDFTVGTKTVSQFNGRNISEISSITQIQPAPDSTIDFVVSGNTEPLVQAGVWNSLEIRSYTPLNASFDTEAPSVPLNLVAKVTTDVSVTLAWSPSTDNIQVGGYEVFQGSTLVSTVPDTTSLILNLQPLTTYNFSVRAFDTKGNRSGFSNSLQVTTLPSSTASTLYYAKATGDITLTTTWGTDSTDGSGANPPNFTFANQNFILKRNASVDSPLTISGTNTKLVVRDGVVLTINNALNAFVETKKNSSVIVNSTTVPNFGTLASNSTISFNNNAATIPGATYGNVVLSGTTMKNFLTGAYVINGDLTIADGVSLSGGAGNSTTLDLRGNLILQGNATMPADANLFTLNFKSQGSQSITSAQPTLSFFQVHIDPGTIVTLAGAGTNTLIAGGNNGGGLSIENTGKLILGSNDLQIIGSGAINPNSETGVLSVLKSDISITSSGNENSNLYFDNTLNTVNQLLLNVSGASQVNVQNPMHIYDALDITNGKINSNDGNIILLSDVDGSARINEIKNQGQVIGSVEYQRFYDYKNGPVYRYVGTPVFHTKVLDWKNYIAINGPFNNFNTAATGATLFYYQESAYVPFPNTYQDEFKVGTGYSILINNTSSFTTKLKGNVQQGDLTYVLSDGWNLLGNPYPSPIKWEGQNPTKWTKSNVSDVIYVRENYYLNGVYTYKYAYSDGGVGGIPGNIIAPGQAFWIQTTDVSPSLKITEAAKANTRTSEFGREQDVEDYLVVTLSQNQNNTDKAYIRYTTQGTNSYERSVDMAKFPNRNVVNVSTLSHDSIALAINNRSSQYCEDHMKLSIEGAAIGKYVLSFDKMESFRSGVVVRLVDHFLSKNIVVDESTKYAFTISADSVLLVKKRFELIVQKPDINANIDVATASAFVCEGNDALVHVNNSQTNVVYEVFSNNNSIGTVTGNGGTVDFNVTKDVLIAGNTSLNFKAAYNGCQSVDLVKTVSINTVKTYKPVLKNSSTAICSGENAKIEVSGLPYGGSYNWYKSADSQAQITATTQSNEFITEPLQKSTSYYVSIANGGCESTERIEVKVHVDYLNDPLISIAGVQLVSNITDGNQWLFNGNIIDGATAEALTPKYSGTYTLAVAQGACNKTSLPYEYVVTGYEEPINGEVTLYPNTVRSKFKVIYPVSMLSKNKSLSFAIYNVQGMEMNMYSYQTNDGVIDIDTKEMTSGLYTIHLKIGEHVVQKKFIKD